MRIVYRKVIDLLRNRDFLSPPIGFEYQGSNKFRCIEGGLYSFLIIILTAVIGGSFAQDMIFRSNPNVLMGKEMIPLSEVKLNKFPIVISTSFNNILSDDVIKLIEADVVYFPIYANLTNGRTVYSQALKKCNLSDYEFSDDGLRNLFNYVSTIGMYCLDHKNLSFFNPYSTGNSAFINLRIQRCHIPGQNGCPLEIDTLIQSISLGISYLDTYIDSKNLTNPVQFYVSAQATVLSNGFVKRFTHRFRNDIYRSDNGWLLSSFEEASYITYDSTSSDYIVNKDPNSIYYNHLYWATFESPYLRLVSTRSYLKLQDFLSNVGGFTSIIYAFIHFLASSQLRFNYLIFLRDLAIGAPSSRQSDFNFKSNKIVEASIHLSPTNNMLSLIKRFSKENWTGKSEFGITEAADKVRDRSTSVNNYVTSGNVQEVSNHFIFMKSQQMSVMKNLSRKLTIVQEKENFFDYAISYICCRKESKLKYETQFLNVESLISIDTYSKIMALTLHS